MDEKRNDPEVLLRVEHLCQYFKSKGHVNRAVDDVNFEIHKGEVFGLVGESGCGKTTTGRSIIKLYDITSGNIWFKGQRICAGTQSYVDHMSACRKKTADAVRALKRESAADPAKKAANDAKIASLEAELKASLAADREEIRAARYDHKHSDREYADKLVADVKAEYLPRLEAAKGTPGEAALQKEYRDRLLVAKKTKLITQIQMIFQDPVASLNPRMTVREIISEGLVINGIKDHAGRYPHEFSGGQKQRVGIARAVIMNPELLIADEPVSALDVSIQAQVINLLNELRAKLNLTILFIAHDLSVVKYFSDRIGVMYYGKMVELATSDELFAHPLHPYTKSLLSASSGRA